jgi:hypothetical protein
LTDKIGSLGIFCSLKKAIANGGADSNGMPSAKKKAKKAAGSYGGRCVKHMLK